MANNYSIAKQNSTNRLNTLNDLISNKSSISKIDNELFNKINNLKNEFLSDDKVFIDNILKQKAKELEYYGDYKALLYDKENYLNTKINKDITMNNRKDIIKKFQIKILLKWGFISVNLILPAIGLILLSFWLANQLGDNKKPVNNIIILLCVILFFILSGIAYKKYFEYFPK